MLKGIDVNQRIEFTSQEDVSEPKTVFVFRPMTSEEMIGLSQDFIDGDKIKLKGKTIIDLLVNSIIEVRNFENETDIRKIINALPTSIVMELVGFVMSVNHLTTEEKKT